MSLDRLSDIVPQGVTGRLMFAESTYIYRFVWNDLRNNWGDRTATPSLTIPPQGIVSDIMYHQVDYIRLGPALLEINDTVSYGDRLISDIDGKGVKSQDYRFYVKAMESGVPGDVIRVNVIL